MDLIAIGNGGAGAGGIEAKYKFVDLPILEADADDDSYVCEFNGAAGANEVGVGAGLSGADLVLTQYASPGTDGTYRTITDNTFQSFYGTVAFYNAFASSPLGWSCVFRLKNINGERTRLMELSATDESAGGNAAMNISARLPPTSGIITSMSSDGVNGVGSGVQAAVSTVYPKADTSYRLVTSVDYVNGLGFSGIIEDADKDMLKLTDYLFFAINEFSPFAGPGAVAGFGYNDYYKCIVGSFCGYASNTGAGQTPMSLTLSKKPCFTTA